MLSEAVEYPTNDEDWVTTVLIGGGLNIAAAFVAFIGIFLFIIPLIGIILGPMAFLIAMLIPLPVAGYLVSVSRTLMDGETVPPRFEEWGDLFVDGVKVAVLVLVYSIPWVLIGLFWFIGVAIGGALSDDVGGIIALLSTLVAGVVAMVYLFAMWVLLPISFVNFARTDRLGAAFDPGALRDVVTDTEYLTAWVIGAVGLMVANFVANSIPLIGLFVVFYAQIAAVYVFTRGAAPALGVDLDLEDGDRAGSDKSLEEFAETGSAGGADDEGEEAEDDGNDGESNDDDSNDDDSNDGEPDESA